MNGAQSLSSLLQTKLKNMNSLQTTEAAMVKTEREITYKNNIIGFAESYARNTNDEHYKAIYTLKADVLKEEVNKLKGQLSVFKIGWKELLNKHYKSNN
jgi:hypothetical protein